jgi:hypothetical protein
MIACFAFSQVRKGEAGLNMGLSQVRPVFVVGYMKWILDK